MESGHTKGIGMMSSTLITVLLWVTALSSGLMAGVYFAFSAFIIKAFDNIETSQAIATMKSINKVILNSSFMPVFFGSSIISLVLSTVAMLYWNEPGTALMLSTGMVCVVGMFVCTVVFNVPLNNLLARLDPQSDNAPQVWLHYQNN